MSPASPSPASMAASTRSVQGSPSRQGVHQPQDSRAKNVSRLRSSPTGQVASSSTMMRAGAEPAARLLRRTEVDRHVEMLVHEKSGRGAARQERGQPAPGAHAAGVLLDDLARGGAHRQLPRAGAVHRTLDAVDLGAAVVAAGEAAEPVGAAIDDVRHVDQRLDIVDHARPPPQPGGLGMGRLVAGDRPVALQRVEQRRLLAADVAPGAGMKLELEREARAEDVLAQKPAPRAPRPSPGAAARRPRGRRRAGRCSPRPRPRRSRRRSSPRQAGAGRPPAAAGP